MIEASRMPLPVADSQLTLKTAPSAVGFTTTGGTRSTSLSRPATAIFGKEIPSRKALVGGKPQTKTTTLRIIHGSQARKTLPRRHRGTEEEFRELDSITRSAPWLFSSSSALSLCLCASVASSDSSPGKRQMRFGCQTLMKSATAAIETAAATTSTNHGPWKFDIKNCGTAKKTPAIKIAGQISSMPRKPAKAQINQKGTISEKK